MTNPWFVRRGGKDSGPFSEIQFKQLAHQGKIVPADQVFNGSTQQWMQAGQIPGLFKVSKARPVAVSPMPPQLPPVASRSRNATIALCSLVAVIVLAGIFFVVRLNDSLKQAKVSAANDRVSQAVTEANDWIAGKSSIIKGEAIEQRLTDALKDTYATESAEGEAALVQVGQRRKQLAEQARILDEQARIKRLEQEATSVFEDAKTRLIANDAGKAIELLRNYVAHPHATQKSDAQKLLAEAEIAISDSWTLETLVAMSDEHFDQVKQTGEIRDGRVTSNLLKSTRAESVKRNLNKAVQQREQDKIAEAKHREHTERLRTRKPDVRNVCWGDSRQTVKQVEELALKDEEDSLAATVELYGRNAILRYHFYRDKLVKVSYFMLFEEFGNPFEVEVPLRATLEEKYGKGEIDATGVYAGGIDMNAASRQTKWDLPRNTIELRAFSNRGKYGRNLFLDYKAKTDEARAYEQEEKQSLEDGLKKGQEKLKKSL